MTSLLIFGAGYSGCATARAALRQGLAVSIVSRGTPALPAGAQLVPFGAAGFAIARARCLLATAPPGEGGDPVLARWAAAIEAAPLTWIGYLSTTGVYGDRQGGWVDEDTPPAPTAERSIRRLRAEDQWRQAAAGRPLDLIRLAGIYGPGRSVFGDVRAGQARRVIKPGHAFGRIHRDDIAEGVLAAMARPPSGTRVLNFTDDAPAESAAVIAEAARLLGVPVPVAVPFEQASAGMSPMARSFWAESRRVRADTTKATLGRSWRYPTYREGLAAILAEEAGDSADQQGDVAGA